MKIKALLIGLLIIMIPLLLLYVCNKKMIRDRCNYNLTCIKNELGNNQTTELFRNKLKEKVIKKKYEQKTQEEEEESNPIIQEEDEEIIEGFFDGVKGWFSGSAPANPNAPSTPMILPPPPNVHHNINESLDSLNKKNSTLVSKKFPPEDNEGNTNLLKTNPIDPNEKNKPTNKKNNDVDKIIDNDLVKSKNVKDISENNEDIKLTNDIKLIKKDNSSKMEKKDVNKTESFQASNNLPSKLFGKCQFFNEKCPEGYSSFGNFSIEGVGSNLSLNCGNIRDTKPAKAMAEIKNNAIYEIHILDHGHGYLPSQPPRITIEGGKGNGASAEAVVDDNGYLKIIKVINPGYNYIETPNIVIEAQSNDSACHFCCKM